MKLALIVHTKIRGKLWKMCWDPSHALFLNIQEQGLGMYIFQKSSQVILMWEPWLKKKKKESLNEEMERAKQWAFLSQFSKQM